jgi:hypothetical protein
MRAGVLLSAILCLLILGAGMLKADNEPAQQAMKQEVETMDTYTFNSINNPHNELAEIEKAIRANIEWAVRGKDTVLSYSSVINNDELFYFSTDSRSKVKGFNAFRDLTENFFMRDDFKAIKVEINDFRIHMSPTLKTAWWSCILNDYNEFQGKPANWENVRWTGVLEKVDGKWRIFQMHFSKAEDLLSD